MPGAPPFSIRPCDPSEAPVLAALGERLFREAYAATHPEPDLTPYLRQTYDPMRLATELARPGVRVFFAVDQVGRPIGYACLRASEPPVPAGVPGKRPMEILRFYVEGAWHGRGVAAALFAACEEEARLRGADALWLALWQEAQRPLGFYRRMGLEVVGTTTFHFGARRDADFVMARPLSIRP